MNPNTLLADFSFGLCLKILQECRIVYTCSARLLGKTFNEEGSRVILSVDRSMLPPSANPKYSPVLVTSLTRMHDMIQRTSGFNLEHISSLHVVTGHSPDFHILRLMPPILKQQENADLLIIFFASQRDVYFAYECLRQSSLMIPSSTEHTFLA